MGAHSTINVKRSSAKSQIMLYVMENMDNDEFLSEMMDLILDKQLLNCNIVPDDFVEEEW